MVDGMKRMTHNLFLLTSLVLAVSVQGAPAPSPNMPATNGVLQTPPAAPPAPRSDAQVVGDAVQAALQALASNHFQVATSAAGVAIEAAVRTVDPGARLLTAEQAAHLREEQGGRDYGFDLRLTVSNAQPVVVEGNAADPARAGGLWPGDLLLQIGDASATNLTLPAALALLRGHEPSTVLLRVQRAGAVVTSEATRVLTTLAPVEAAEKWPRDLAYMKINGLYAPDAGRSVVAALRGWSETGRFGFILDLRGATGDDLTAVEAIASLFARAGTQLCTFRDRQDQDVSSYKARSGDPLQTPVVVLVDEATTGAAEVLAAVLSDSVRGALLLGAPTAGDPLIRDAVHLPGDYLVYLATRRLVTAEGTVYDGHAGLEPDVAATRSAASDFYEPDLQMDRRATLAQEIEDRALRDRWRGDPALRQAVDVLLGLKALNIRAGGVSSK
jgi:C-terminal peptidase prc